MPQGLAESLTDYGVSMDAVLDLRGSPRPETIRYLGLGRGEQTRNPDAVLEVQHQPLAYVIDGLSGAHLRPPEIRELRRRVSFRGDAPYLAVARPGELTVYALGLDSSALDASVVSRVVAGTPGSRGVFQTLAVQPPSPTGIGTPALAVHKLLFRLLSATISGLREAGVDADDALSLAGRALFMRFLVDRHILGRDHWHQVCPGCQDPVEFFNSAEQAFASCRWLDQTFNGDFLPLGQNQVGGGPRRTGSDAWGYLSDIMRRAPGGQLTLDWGDVDFAHVPVGVLSEVYEHQAETWEPERRRREAQYYTPRRLAEYVVAEVFRGIEEHGPCRPSSARVLDPAVGAGVFLVAALREIVAAKWRDSGVPPTTASIREQLYGQLTGFDINESALRLASLSLYLTAVEVDPDPHPIESLRFERMRGTVLRLVSTNDAAPSRAGSVGPLVGPDHACRYDAVVGNPPWTSLPGDSAKTHREMLDVIRPIVEARLGVERLSRFEVADRAPDVPFFWRALEWTREDGWIGLIMHGRLLFKQSAGGRRTRESLFAAAEVTGVLNGADLVSTHVWPNVNAPFCVVFARNKIPVRDYPFLFASPYVEPAINSQGRLRIDVSDARPVSSAAMTASPHLLKTLFRGTRVDLSILQRVRASAPTSVGTYWDEHRLGAGEGYQLGRQPNRTRGSSHLIGLPEVLPSDAQRGVGLVLANLTRTFEHEAVEWPRSRSRYSAPLVLVPESLRLGEPLPKAHVADFDVVFNESFRGYSAAGHPEGPELVRYLALLIHTRVFTWHSLMTSGKFGVDRRVVQGRDVQSLPFVPPEQLPSSLRGNIPDLLAEVDIAPGESWPITDQWVSQVYGLDEWEFEAICDTVNVGLPFESSIARAVRPPTQQQVAVFVVGLGSLLRASGCRCHEVEAVRPGSEWATPWTVLDVMAPEDGSTHESPDGVYSEADALGASRVVMPRGPGAGARLGILREFRYWTPTRARLTALDLLNDHAESLGLAP